MIKTKKYLIFFLAFILWIHISGCALFFPPKGGKYYFPEFYRGWMCISYNVEGAPPLHVEDGYLVHKIPGNGLLVTSSAPRLIAPKHDEYYYYSDKGVREAEELQQGGGYTKQRKAGLELEKEIRLYFVHVP